MAFDAADFVIDPKSLTTPRARLEYLRDFLRGLPRERFNMASWPWPGGTLCGTAACIGGWADALFGDDLSFDTRGALGLNGDQDEALFYPDEYLEDSYTPQEAARVLDHLIKTGEVDWSVARQEAS